MTLRELLSITCETTPIRIYKYDNPYKPLIKLIYKSNLLKYEILFQNCNYNLIDDFIIDIKPCYYDEISYLVITIN